jgi:hypothetical protein
MDELTLLRELEADVPPMTARARYDARLRLRYEIAYERRPARTSQLVPLLAGAATAAVMGGALLVLDDGPATPPEPPIQITSSAAALKIAAQVAGARSTGPIPRDDQYLYRKEITDERPLDGTGPKRTYVDENWVSIDGSRPTRNSELGTVWTTPGGGDGWPPMRFEALERLPTDPGRLLLHIRDWPEDGLERDDPMSPEDHHLAYDYLSMLLFHQPPMPPALRAAAFEAMARIPGVRTRERVADARGRPGLEISRPGAGQALILDPATYEYLGFSDTDVNDDGVPVSRLSSRVAAGIVDEIGERPRG